MYGMNYRGGHNCTHGQIERADRIDSFEAGKVEGWGMILASRDGKVLPLRCNRFPPRGPTGRELVELSYPGSRWRDTLELARMQSGFGGSRAFWLCPICGRRARFLYFKGRGFVCRGCAALNYRSQQRTRDSINHYQDGLKLARDKLGWEAPFPVTPMDFLHIVPGRPKGMHGRTYYRYLAQYRQYQEKYRRDSLREMLALLRR